MVWFGFSEHLLLNPRFPDNSHDVAGGVICTQYVPIPENKESVQQHSSSLEGSSCRIPKAKHLLSVSTGKESLENQSWYHGKI